MSLPRLETDEINQFLREMHAETDRGAALVGAVLVDESLLACLRANMRSGKASDELLIGASAPLGTFSARIKACFCLRLIYPNQFDDSQLVRKIRNEFAHGGCGLSFESPNIKAMCGKLSTSSLADAPRMRYVLSVAVLSASIQHLAAEAAQLRDSAEATTHDVATASISPM